MKRKSPPNDKDRNDNKRRRLSANRYERSSTDNDLLSPLPLRNITNTSSQFISPRPAPLLRKKLHKKRLLQQTKKVTLTDDEDNIIHEDKEMDIDELSDVEIGRGIDKNEKDEFDDLDEDPFAIIDYDTDEDEDEEQDKENKAPKHYFETIPGINNKM